MHSWISYSLAVLNILQAAPQSRETSEVFYARFIFAACGSGPALQKAAVTPTPVITSTPAITSISTPPNVKSTLVHFITQDHVQLAGWFYGNDRTMAIICLHKYRGTKDDWSDSALTTSLHLSPRANSTVKHPLLPNSVGRCGKRSR